MQFIKKNYEKVVLGLILFGLLVAVASLPFLVANEKQQLAEFSARISVVPPKPLPAPDLSESAALLKRAASRTELPFSDNTHKLLNPVRWQKTADGRFIKNPPEAVVEKVEIAAIKPLYLVIYFEAVSVSETRTLYTVSIEDQAASKGRGKRPFYVAPGDKREFGESKNFFILRNVQGPTNNPTALILELGDMDRPATVSQDTPFKRVDGYMADLKYPPTNSSFPNRRKGDRIVIAGENYNVVAITENEVTLASPSGKKWTIKYNPER